MKEKRIFDAPVEVRDASDSTATIEGYAAVFGNSYEIAGMFTESVDPKAFNKSLRERADELAVVSFHDADRVLGTVASGTAEFWADERGLKYRSQLDLLDPDGIGMHRKVLTGKVRQSSFSFEVVKDLWEEREGELPHRTLKEVRLWEASPVLWGANPETQVDVSRAVASYAEYRGVDTPATTIAEIQQIREATTEEPAVEPPQALDTTPDQPEPARTFDPYL